MSESTRTDGTPLDLTHLTLSSGGKGRVRDYEPKGANSPQKRHEIYEKR